MGVNTDGILAYGINLGGEEEWRFKGDVEHPLVADADPDNDDGFHDRVMRALRKSVGFEEVPWNGGRESWSRDERSAYYRAEDDADKRHGIELVFYCSCDYPMYILATHEISVRRGDAKRITLDEFDSQRSGWHERLQVAVDVLGIEPLDPVPGWYLVSLWC